jgi:hypothetical protein
MGTEIVAKYRRLVLAGMLAPSPMVQRLAAEHDRAAQLADQLGIHDMALHLSEATGHSYPQWVDRLALGAVEGRAAREARDGTEEKQ